MLNKIWSWVKRKLLEKKCEKCETCGGRGTVMANYEGDAWMGEKCPDCNPEFDGWMETYDKKGSFIAEKKPREVMSHGEFQDEYC